ncbi:MAG: GAF domain-containing protein [Fimbriimonadaceae bacterium]
MMFWRAFRGVLTFAPLVLSGCDVVSWTVGSLACALGVAAIAIEAFLTDKGSTSSDGWEGLILVESAAIVVLLAGLHLSVGAGVLVLIPFIARRQSADIGPRTSFVAAALVLFAGWATGRGWAPAAPEIASAAGVAAVAWLISRTSPAALTLVAAVPAAFAPIQPTPDELYESLRERYRKLREAHKNLELEVAASRAIVSLAAWRSDDERTPSGLAKTVREIAGVEGAAIFVVPDARDGFALAGSSGTAPNDVFTLPTSLQASPIVLRETVERELLGAGPVPTSKVAAALLTDRGRLIGVAALFDADRSALEAGVVALERISSFAAGVVREEHEARRQRERIAQLELLNRFTGRSTENTPADAARTICDDLASELTLDGCAIVDLTGSTPKSMAAVGDEVTDMLKFAGGVDLRGWMGAGANELVIDDARDDQRCDEALALRRGVGSMMVQPLVSSGSLIGALIAWTTRRRGISSVAIGALRALSPFVLRHVFGGFATTRPGLVDADTFWHGTQGPGSFIEIDLGRTSEPSASQELQEARRHLLTTALGRLPAGGLMTRRSAGTLLAFLPAYDETSAQKWAVALRPHADERWEMRVDGRGQSQQTRQFFERMSA